MITVNNPPSVSGGATEFVQDFVGNPTVVLPFDINVIDDICEVDLGIGDWDVTAEMFVAVGASGNAEFDILLSEIAGPDEWAGSVEADNYLYENHPSITVQDTNTDDVVIPGVVAGETRYLVITKRFNVVAPTTVYMKVGVLNSSLLKTNFQIAAKLSARKAG